MSIKLLWQSTEGKKRAYSEIWSKGARAYLRGYHAGQSYFESLETSDRRLAQKLFTKRAAEIIAEYDVRKTNRARCNFAYAVALYFGSTRPEEKDPTGRVARIFDKWAKKFLDEISQRDLDLLAVEIYPEAGPKTLNREVYTPFVAVYNAAVADNKALPRMCRRPKGAHDRAPTRPPADHQINRILI